MLTIKEEGSQRDVMFNQRATYHGRNGFGHCCGLHVWDLNAGSPKAGPQDSIFIEPINSKGVATTACTIQVPREHLVEVCLALGPLDELLSSPAIRDRLPLLIGMNPALDRVIEQKIKEG